MKSILKLSSIAIALCVFYVGCSDVGFEAIPQDRYFLGCVIKAEYGDRCSFSNSSRLGSVDILFVNDNSGSMSTEQSKMADKFSDFIQTLDSQNIDYQIAITTTDISGQIASGVYNYASAWNGNGAFQDGKFISFPNGASVLKSTSLSQQQKIDYFSQTIQRPETLHCEQSNYRECPSSDERGIFAINKVLDRADSDFFRADSLFSVVILSDEDVRSNGGIVLPLAPEDTPDFLVSRLASTLGPTKAMSVHSLIVPPGDTTCKNSQDAQGNGAIVGEYGSWYAKLSNPTAELSSLGNILPGRVGSICSSSYTNHLIDIASRISTSSFNFTLPCKPVSDSIASDEGFDPIQISVLPDPGFEVQFSVDEQSRVSFNPNLPAGSNVEYTVVCEKK